MRKECLIAFTVINSRPDHGLEEPIEVSLWLRQPRPEEDGNWYYEIGQTQPGWLSTHVLSDRSVNFGFEEALKHFSYWVGELLKQRWQDDAIDGEGGAQ